MRNASEEYRLRIVFNDGSENVVDSSGWLGEGEVFPPLQDVRFLQRLYLDGGRIVWPNGARLRE